MTVEEIDALFGKYREGPLTPSDFKEIMQDILGAEIELPLYMSRIMTSSDYKIMVNKLKEDGVLTEEQADSLALPEKFYGLMNVSDLKQRSVYLATSEEDTNIE